MEGLQAPDGKMRYATVEENVNQAPRPPTQLLLHSVWSTGVAFPGVLSLESPKEPLAIDRDEGGWEGGMNF